MMTRNDYELVARVLRQNRPAPVDLNKSQTYRWRAIVDTMADELEDTFPKFKRGAFLKLCGYAD